jgi:excinuclease ABC subunit A
MGPEGGEEGGLVIAAGTPEEVAAEPASHTGAFLARTLTPALKRGAATAGKSPKRRQTAKVRA